MTDFYNVGPGKLNSAGQAWQAAELFFWHQCFKYIERERENNVGDLEILTLDGELSEACCGGYTSLAGSRLLGSPSWFQGQSASANLKKKGTPLYVVLRPRGHVALPTLHTVPSSLGWPLPRLRAECPAWHSDRDIPHTPSTSHVLSS